MRFENVRARFVRWSVSFSLAAFIVSGSNTSIGQHFAVPSEPMPYDSFGIQSNPTYTQFGDYSNQAALDSDTPQRFKPVVGLEMGIISLGRESPASQVLAVDPSSNVLLDANQLQGDMGTGLDATLNLFNLFSDHKAIDVQLRYFQAGDMNATERITSSDNILQFFNAVPADPASSNDIVYESRLRSVEANLVGRTPYRLRFLTGFRFFEVDERLDMINLDTSGATTTNGFFSRTENTLAGFQLGTEGTLYSNRLSRIFGSFKWAILNNDIIGVGIAQNPTTGGELQADAYDTTTSQMLDFQLGGSLNLSRWLSLYVGYQGIVVSDLGTAIEQNRVSSIFAGPSNPISYQDVQYHGFRLTGMATW